MTDWNCARTEERLSDYLDGILSPAEAAEFSAHAGSCDACGKLVKQVGGLVHQMRALDALEAPPQLIPKILESTLGPRRKQSAGWQRWVAWVPQFWQPRFAMGAITVAATLLIVLYAAGISPGEAEEGRPQPRERFSHRQQTGPSHLRAQRQIRERPPRGIRNPDALAARRRAFPFHHAGPRAGTELAAALRESTGKIADLAASQSQPIAQRHDAGVAAPQQLGGKCWRDRDW